MRGVRQQKRTRQARVPRRRSYHTTKTLTTSVATMTAIVGDTSRLRRPCSIERPTPSRNSSKHEIDRNPTMPSAPSVSNLSWPYGMVLVGRAAGDGDEHDADDIVQHVEPRLERGAEHGERAGADSDDDF